MRPTRDSESHCRNVPPPVAGTTVFRRRRRGTAEVSAGRSGASWQFGVGWTGFDVAISGPHPYVEAGGMLAVAVSG